MIFQKIVSLGRRIKNTFHKQFPDPKNSCFHHEAAENMKPPAFLLNSSQIPPKIRGACGAAKSSRKSFRGTCFPITLYGRRNVPTPGFLLFLARSEVTSCKWHFPDPDLIAEALKCKKILKIQGFSHFLHNVAQRWYPGIIVGSRCGNVALLSASISLAP